MNYKSISPQLKSSCYNCTHFQASHDMLNGLCFQQSAEHGIPAVGVGTCSRFTAKADTGLSRNGAPLRMALNATRQARAAR